MLRLWLRIWHRHRWEQLARTYAASAKESGVTNWKWESHMPPSFWHGVTTFVFRCGDVACGDLKKIEALGRIEAVRKAG